MSNIPDYDLAHEEEIIWVHSPQRFPFVRESFAPQSSARWPTKCQDDRVIVAYAVRRRGSGAKYFRQFYFMRRDSNIESVLPSEAVDPMALEIGVPGRRTARCRETMTPNDKRYIARIFAKKNAPKKKKKRVNSPNET